MVARGADHQGLYRLAMEQAGYFTPKQAKEFGFGWNTLSHFVREGRFEKIERGIYRLSHAPHTPFEEFYLAWLRTGGAGAISHESALSLYELTDLMPARVHVTVPRTASRRRRTPDRLHWRELPPEDIAARQGLPVTNVERTIADLARSGLAREHLETAIRQALERGLTDSDRLLEQANRSGGRAKRVIERMLEADGDPGR